MIEQHFIDYDLRRLESYTRNLVDYHLILDLVPVLARLYYLNRLPIDLTVVQMALLAGIGLQHKTIDQLEKELNLPQSQLLALFNKLIKKIIDVRRSTISRSSIVILSSFSSWLTPFKKQNWERHLSVHWKQWICNHWRNLFVKNW